MLGKTHFFVGAAAGLAVFHPASIPVLIAGTSAGALGGVISDIDSGNSGAQNKADKIICACLFAVAAVILIDKQFHVGIYERLMSNSSGDRILYGTMAFVLICAFGKAQQHRTFMHSILALILLSICVHVIFPDIARYFAVGYATHILIDLLNRTRVHVMWPAGKGFCFKLFKSDGLVNWLLMSASVVALVLLIFTSEPVQTHMEAISAYFKALF